jgi:hypothetical protein
MTDAGKWIGYQIITGSGYSFMMTMVSASQVLIPDVILGDRDYIFCLSNCAYPTNQAELFLNALFPNAAQKATYLQPNAGHLIAQHYTAEDSFSHTLEFLQSSGL